MMQQPPTAECLAVHYPKLIAMLVRMGFAVEDAEDAAAEAVVTGLRYIRSGKALGLTYRTGWLRSVAINAAKKTARRRRQRREIALLCIDIPAPVALPEEEKAEVRRLLCEAVDGLPPAHRALVVFCYVEGSTYTQAARRFGLALGVVTRRLHDARDRLAAALSEKGLCPSVKKERPRCARGPCS